MTSIGISPRINVWSCDVPCRSHKTASLAKGDGIGLGDMHATCHVGVRTDAPMHYKLGGRDAASLPLGPWQVVEVRVRRFGLFPRWN